MGMLDEPLGQYWNTGQRGAVVSGATAAHSKAGAPVWLLRLVVWGGGAALLASVVVLAAIVFV